MTARIWRKAAAIVALALVRCGGPPAAPPKPPPACVAVGDANAALAYDWAGAYGIDAASANRIKAAVAASLELRKLAAQLDADLETGCGGLAIDLGASGDFKTGKDACDAATRALKDARQKLGKATLAVEITPPKCGAPLDVVADCAERCGASAPSPSFMCEPGKLQGNCTGSCTGSCDVVGGAKCTGTCSGKCDGKCKGKCEGVASRGVCSGTCVGSCTGACTGSCELATKAACSGTCTGSCDAEMKSPRCTGETTAPATGVECAAGCSARAEAKADCTPAHVGATVKGGDKALGKKLKTALEKDLPMVLKVSLGMGERSKKLAADVRALVDGARAAAGGPMAAALSACVAGPFSEGIAAAASIDASLSASAGVSASVR